jgi:hypothetical protein
MTVDVIVSFLVSRHSLGRPRITESMAMQRRSSRCFPLGFMLVFVLITLVGFSTIVNVNLLKCKKTKRGE